MKQFLFTLTFSLIIITTLAQDRRPHSKTEKTNGPSSFISGTLISENGDPIPYASVAAFNQNDSSQQSGSASTENGFFKVSVKKGRYFLNFSFLSYKTKTISNIVIEDTPYDIGNVVMQTSSQILKEVEINAERNQMELKLDKRIFNIEKDLANAGSNAAEILNNIPSVQVDIEGTISLRGSENVRVLIDGKPSTITGGSTADVLRQFQGNMIERVEVITNPSARYDAEGEVGIINIVLKKDERKGLNGSVESVVGYPDNHRLSFILNYRTPKYNLFTSYGISYRKSPGGGTNFQQFDNTGRGIPSDTAFYYESDNDRNRKSLGQNIRVGSDLFINKWNTVTVSGLFNFSDQENISELEYRDFGTSKELFQTVERIDVEAESGENIEFSINHTKKFSDENRKWSTDFQWSESDDLEESTIHETNFRTADLLLQNTSNIEANRTLLAQSGYVHPLRNDRVIEGGIRSTLRTIENVFSVEESKNGGAFNILSQFNNNFLYEENVYAAYLQFGNEIEKFSYQLGIRAEYSDISSTLKLTNENVNQEYFNLFPSAFLTYKISKFKQFQLSYSSRINRPNYRYLLPFQTFSDNRNLWRGNPNLRPEYTDSYEFGFLRYFEKGSLFSSVYYRHRTGVIDRIIETNENGITERFPVNLAVENNVGLEFNGNYKFSKKTSFNANFNFFRANRSGTFEGQILKFDIFTWSSRGTLKSELIKELEFQASFNYRAPQETTQGRTKSVYSLDLSAGKDVLKGKGTIVASVRDAFNSRKRRSIVETEFLYSESEFQWRARQFLLTFSYRINQKKQREKNGRGYDGGDDF